MAISAPYTIASVTALTALTSSQRANGYARYVLNTEVTGQPPSWYVFDAGSSRSEFGNIILIPDDNPSNGRWIKASPPYTFSDTDVPDVIPPFVGILFKATIDGNDLYFISTGASSTADWTPYGNELVSMSGSPSAVVTPGYIGQMIWDVASNNLYISEGLSVSDWVQVV